MSFKTTTSLLRTNVKLSTNVKLNITSADSVYMNSFDDINTYIQNSKYKNYYINPNSYYQFDLCKFWGDGNTPKDYIYQLKSNDDTVIKDSFDKEFITDYCYGFEINTNNYFTEEFKFFAPLWVQDTIPDKFIIFRIKGGIYTDVREDIINNSEIVKIFDLKNSNVGRYLNNYITQDEFPSAPLYVDYDDNNFTRYVGIDLDRGGFVNSAEFNHDDFIKDTPLIYFENFITGGFERNKVAIANLINLEFLFDDITADNDVYKYVGFYVYDNIENELEIDNFSIDNNIATLQFVNPVINYDLIKDDNSIYYLNNKGITKKIDKLISDNTTIQYPFLLNDDKNIIDYGNYILNENAEAVIGRGTKYAALKIYGTIQNNNYLYIGKTLEERKIISTTTLPARTNSNRYFSNQGTINDILYAMKKAIEYICSDIVCVIKDNVMLICLKEWKIIDTYDALILNDNILDFDIELLNNGIFNGKFDGTKNKFRIGASDKNFIEENIEELYVKTSTGYTQINQIYLNLSEPIYDFGDNLIDFKDVDSSLIIEFKDIPLLENKQLYFYKKSKCEVGRFSFVNICDFDFDFYSTEYQTNIWDEFYLKMFYTNQSITQSNYNTWIQYNNITYTSKKIDYVENFNYLEVIDTMVIVYNNELYGSNIEVTKTNILNSIRTIKQEFYEFMFDTFGLIIEYDLVLTNLGELRFIQYDYFKKLITLLGNDIDGIVTDNVVNEYDRLKENYTKEYAIVSRTIPYVNKWVKEFTDIKERQYRLNTNLSFGVDNFTPSFEVKIPTPQFYTHEWYYLGEYPRSNGNILQNFIDNSPAYINQLNDINSFFDTNFDLAQYLKNDKDYFYEYFTIEKIMYNNSDGEIDTKYINPVKRFSTFKSENTQDFYQTFFRGVKLYVKTLKNFETINSNLGSIEYVYNDDFKDYKFSAILQPNYYEYKVEFDGTDVSNITTTIQSQFTDVEFKVIKNEKYKHVLFLIQVRIPYISSVSTNKIILDYNLLYNLKSFSFINSSSELQYLPTPLSGSIDISNPLTGGVYRGIANNSSSSTKFTSEIFPGEDGVFTDNILFFEINPFGDDILRYKITGIDTILGDDLIKLSSPVTVIVPPIESSDEYYKRTNIFLEHGGKNYFSNLFQEVSFASIYESINLGDSKIKYITVKEDNTIIEGTTNFILEFEKPDNLDIVNKLTIAEDLDKPNSLLLSNDIIGYDYVVKEGNNLVNINRYKGSYYPKFRSVVNFTDIGLQEKDKNKNLQIDFDNIGIIENYYYNRTSLKTSKNIITVDASNYTPLYPLVSEICIDKYNKNTFLSTWDNDYFIASYGKKDDRQVPGSFSDIDEKTFFGGKAIKTIEGFGLDVLTSDEVKYTVTNNALKIDLFLENSITKYFYSYVENIMKDYIDFTQIQYTTKEDYINNYILKNIMPKYFLSSIEVYLLESKDKQVYDLVAINLTKDQKLSAGFKQITNYGSNFIDNSFFNKSLNLTMSSNSNYKYYSIGVTISKHKYR